MANKTDFRVQSYEETFSFIFTSPTTRSRFKRMVLPGLRQVIINVIGEQYPFTIHETIVETKVFVLSFQMRHQYKTQQLHALLASQADLMNSICCDQCGFEQWQHAWKIKYEPGKIAL